MYAYIKKVLLVLSILAIPCMNSASQALLEDEHDTIFRGQQLMAQAQQDEGEAQTSWMSRGASFVKRAGQVTVDGICSLPSIGARVTYTSLSMVLSDSKIATGVRVLFLATGTLACYCTCLPDANKQTCAYMGQSTSNDTCRVQCAVEGFNKNYLCAKNLAYQEQPTATACFCTCLPDLLKKSCAYIGLSVSSNACGMQCAAEGYIKNSICIMP